MMISSIPLISEAGTSATEGTDEEPTDFPVAEIENDNEQTILGPVIDINEMIDAGLGNHFTIDVNDPYDLSSLMTDLDWMYNRKGFGTMASPIVEDSDSADNPIYLTDGADVTHNVTSTISGTSITFDDQDFFQINLTSDGVNGTADKLELTIISNDALSQNSSLTVEALQPNFLLQTYQDTGFESIGKFHGSSKKMVFVPEGDPMLNFEVPYVFTVSSWNSTTLNYTLKVEITQTTRTEWNGFLGGGPEYNTTNKPPKMQSINRSYDFIDWFDLTGSITEKGMNTQRGDQIKFGISVDVATEERGRMWNPYGIYGVESPTSTIMFVYLAWFNYSANQLNVWNTGGNLPYASMLFGNDPLTLNFQSMASNVWVGMSPLSLWGNGNNYYAGAEGNGEMFFNVSQIVTSLIPPNEAPVLSSNIEDQNFDEDTGPWNITDLNEHFFDAEHNAATGDSIPPLEYIVSNPVGVNNPDELKLTIKDGRYLWAEVTKANWHGEGQFRIKCEDYGVADASISVDDREARSNIFTIDVDPVNDDAFIEKVDTGAGEAQNNHEIIDIYISQNSNMYRSKKVFGRDNDTEDVDRLVYTHNASTPAFYMNDKGQIDFIPTNDDVGETYVRIWVDDRNGDDEDDYLDLRFIVSNINDKPSLVDITWSDGARSFDLTGTEDTPTFKNVREDFEINLTVTATDPDILIGMPDELTWVIGSNGWEVFNHPTDPLKAYVTYTPTNEDAVRTTVESVLSCMDTSNTMSKEITIRLMVDNVNDPPMILTVSDEAPDSSGSVKRVVLNEPTGKHGFEDTLYSIKVSSEDIDPGDTVTFKSSDTAFQFYPDPLDRFAGNFTILPTQDMVGMHTVIFTVTDEDGDTDSVTVDFEIVNTNDPPSDTFSVDWDTTVDFVVGNNLTFYVEDLEDPDNDELVVSWDFGDNSEILEGDIVTHSFVNDQTYIITVTVRDPSGAKVEKTRTVTIYPQEVEEPDDDLDTDEDGIPDIWEDEHGLNKLMDDANLDKDSDGFLNIEEYEAGTNPLDPRSHPPKESTDDDGNDMLLIIAIIIVVLFIIIAVAFFFFALTRKPKQVVQQQAYAPETGLPGQGQPGLAPGGQQQIASGAVSPQLPPAAAEEKKEEPLEELPDSFLLEAQDQLKQESEPAEGEDNVWRPPVEEPESDQESQVDDLFADAPEEESVPEEQEPPAEETEVEEEPKGVPSPPTMPPPPPKF